MSLGNDQHENDPAGASGQTAAAEQAESDEGLTMIAEPFQPPQPPAPQNPAHRQPKKWRENAKLGLEIGGLAVLIFYTIFSCFRWLQIRWTNRLTREALDHTEYSINATLGKMQEQIDAEHTQIRADQRAWLLIKFTNPFQWKQNQPIISYMEIDNVGKTAALNMTGDVMVELLPLDQVPDFFLEKGPRCQTVGGFLFPGETDQTAFQCSVYEPRTTPAQEHLLTNTDEIEFGARHTFLATHGRIDYYDAFGVHHWFTFCTMSLSGPNQPLKKWHKGLEACLNYQNIDSNIE